MLQTIAGLDPLDATASPRPVPDYLSALAQPVSGLRIGVPENFFFHGLDPEMEAGVRAAIETLRGLGAHVEEIRLPDPQAISDVTNIVSRSEATALHGHLLRERPQDLGPFTRARLELGLRIPAHDYLQALRLRARMARAFSESVWDRVDLLTAPVIPEPAPPLTDALDGSVEEITVRQGRFSRFTRPFNGLGLPALSVPCGFSRAGLPLAFQIVGRPFDEATVLRAGHAYQCVTDWHTRMPDLRG
jgi:aspartyl-tRNA(Asn)/glutamyl-tRNA(Gln) amidotransferase subunit A